MFCNEQLKRHLFIYILMSSGEQSYFEAFPTRGNVIIPEIRLIAASLFKLLNEGTVHKCNVGFSSIVYG